MRSTGGSLAIAVFLAICAGTAPVDGQNLLLNPRLDVDLAGWQIFGIEGVEWDPFDRDGSPASGSALATNQQTEKQLCAGMQQFVEPIVAGDSYEFGAHAWMASGQGEGDQVLLELSLRAGPCPGTPVTKTSFLNVFGPFDQWVLARDLVTAPPTTGCAVFTIGACKQAADGEFLAYFDDLFLRPILFADGFESGDASAWSATVP